VGSVGGATSPNDETKEEPFDGPAYVIDALQSWRTALDAPNLVWYPRLTAGLYAVGAVLEAKTVIIPNICCPAVVYGIILSGAKPAFCEVDPRSGALDLDACEKLLTSTKADMVVHIHPFGLYSDRDALHERCRRHGAFFFEDGASWFPPTPKYELKAASCLGLSFGWSKIFDLGGGSLLAFEDPQLAVEIENFLHRLPPPPVHDIRREFERRFNAMAANDCLQRPTETDLSTLGEAFRSHWIGNTQNLVGAPSTGRIQRERRRRIELADAFSELLRGYPVQFLHRSGLDFPWRFCFLCTDTNLVRNMFPENEFSIWRLYPALDRVFPKYPHSEDLNKSYEFANQIFNVAISPDVTIHGIRSAIRRYRINAWKRRLRPVRRLLAQGRDWAGTNLFSKIKPFA
jgi:dTDP-4-amino-4,6-dideoxygalactose transaminase